MLPFAVRLRTMNQSLPLSSIQSWQCLVPSALHSPSSTMRWTRRQSSASKLEKRGWEATVVAVDGAIPVTLAEADLPQAGGGGDGDGTLFPRPPAARREIKERPAPDFLSSARQRH